MRKLSLVLMLFFFSQYAVSAQPIACGKEWINIHKGNDKLIGIYVSQYPDNLADRKLYEGNHPVAVYYLFTDRMVHAVTYTPSGQIQDGHWYAEKDSKWVKDKISKEFKEDVFCAFWVK